MTQQRCKMLYIIGTFCCYPITATVDVQSTLQDVIVFSCNSGRKAMPLA